MSAGEWELFSEEFGNVSSAPEFGSVFKTALALLNVDAPDSGLFRFEGGKLYFHLKTFSALFGKTFLAQAKMQWKVEAYLVRWADESATGMSLAALRANSLALGICQQALLLRIRSRIGAGTPETGDAMLARWFADPARAPRGARAAVLRILEIQKWRNSIAHCWDELRKVESFNPCEAPPVTQGPGASSVWKGLPVCPGSAHGTPVLESARAGRDGEILVFRRARPQVVEYFGSASAVIFSGGGILSHACSIARERGIPCVTGLGEGFYRALETRISEGEVLLTLDGGAGTVEWDG